MTGSSFPVFAVCLWGSPLLLAQRREAGYVIMRLLHSASRPNPGLERLYVTVYLNYIYKLLIYLKWRGDLKTAGQGGKAARQLGGSSPMPWPSSLDLPCWVRRLGLPSGVETTPAF